MDFCKLSSERVHRVGFLLRAWLGGALRFNEALTAPFNNLFNRLAFGRRVFQRYAAVNEFHIAHTGPKQRRIPVSGCHLADLFPKCIRGRKHG